MRSGLVRLAGWWPGQPRLRALDRGSRNLAPAQARPFTCWQCGRSRWGARSMNLASPEKFI